MAETQMRWIPAEFVEQDDILMRNAQIIRVVKIERPHAIIRRYVDGKFGPREIIVLEGKYFTPSEAFLIESGIFEEIRRTPKSSVQLVGHDAEVAAAEPSFVLDFGGSAS